MQKQSILCHKASFGFRKSTDGIFASDIHCRASNSLLVKSIPKTVFKATVPSGINNLGWDLKKLRNSFRKLEIRSIGNENLEEISNEDDELCPAECVREFRGDDEFLRILEKAKATKSLVVVDFYRTACGSCKYIEQIFSKLCKGSGNEEAQVIFLKHNVIDEYDEQSEVAERLRIKAVPLFHFYKDGVLLEAFPTRDKERLAAAILKYTAPGSQDL